jgi:two-component system, cell cycle sensor histidine kinase and response regulator CckA
VGQHPQHFVTERTEQPQTILLVDDEPSMRQMIDQVLRTAGFRVLVAREANEAAEIWSRKGPQIDLLLTDILLPGLSGPELAREFLSSRPDLKVLIISGSQEEIVLKAVELAGAKVFLAKPFNHRGLLEAVQDSLT